MTATPKPTTRTYDLICFGDEVPGILAIVSAAREYRRRTGKHLRTLLMFKGNSREGVGGHLVRGGLAYLDRSCIPQEVRFSLGLPTFGDPVAIYQEFLRRVGVNQIALDPRKADTVLRNFLSEIGADMISRVTIAALLKQGNTLSGIRLTNGETYLASQFIDCTVNAELAQGAGVKKLQGFETFGLPESELPVTLVFETEGLTVPQLRNLELAYIRRFLNLNDMEAQRYLAIAAGNNPTLAEQWRRGMVDVNGNPMTFYAGPDFIDVRCRALSIAYHSFRGKKWSLKESGMILDQGNIAILGHNRLSWNALMFYTTGAQAEVLARNAAKPTPPMLQEIAMLETWFRSLGATALRPTSELYIRHAGNITGVVKPLSGAEMLAGGVPATEAIGTFGYHLDVRGGITGLGNRATTLGIGSITFHAPPLFNIGILHALVRTVPNLAVISPASGFDGYACAAGRIIEFNVGVGQGVGIAAAIAIASQRQLATITNLEVRQVLAQTGQLTRIYGRSNPAEAARLQNFEIALGGPIGISVAQASPTDSDQTEPDVGLDVATESAEY